MRSDLSDRTPPRPLSVYDWSEAIQERIIRETGAELDEEPMALEDIFLELHR